MLDVVRALLVRLRAARVASEEAERTNAEAEQLLIATRWEEVSAAMGELRALAPPYVDALRRLLEDPDADVRDEARRVLSLVRPDAPPPAAPPRPPSWETRAPAVEAGPVKGEDWAELVALDRARALDRAVELAQDAMRTGQVRHAALQALLATNDPRAWDGLALATGVSHVGTWSVPAFDPWAALVALDRPRALELAWRRVDAPLFRSTEGLGPGPGELSVFQAALRLLVDAGDARAWPLLEAEPVRDGARGRWARPLRERRSPPPSAPASPVSKLDALARRLLGRPLTEVDPGGLPAARERLEAEGRAEAAALAALARDPAPDGEEWLALPTRRPSRKLPRRTVHLPPPAAVCATCQGPLAPLPGRGASWTAEHVDWQAGAPAVVEYVRARLRCPVCKGRVAMARLPRGPKGLEPAFLAELVVAKLVERTSLSALAARPGWPDAPGLARGLLGAAVLLEPIAKGIRAELLAGGAVSVARAEVLVAERPAPLWAHRGPRGAVLVVAELHPPDDAPAALLRRFAGSIQSETSLDDALFADRTRLRAGQLRALRDALLGSHLEPREELVLRLAFERLLAVEARLRDATPEARHAARQAELRPLLDELLAWLDDRRAATPGETVADRARDGDLAWRYRERDALLRLLEDGRLDADAGAARRALDRIVCGRAGWTLAPTAGLARFAATLHTVVGSALDLGLDPRVYLTDAFGRVRDDRPLLTPRARSSASSP